MDQTTKRKRTRTLRVFSPGKSPLKKKLRHLEKAETVTESKEGRIRIVDFKTSAIHLLVQSKYIKLMKMLVKYSDAAKRALMKVHQGIIQKEVSIYYQQ